LTKKLDASGSALEIRKPVDIEIIGVASAAGLNISVVQQSGLNLSDLFESESKIFNAGLSGPLPSEILNTFEKMSRNILPPSPKEVQTSVKSEEIEVQASVKSEEVEVQTLVGENRLEVPRLH
jgi:hypothetical protein